MPSWPCVGTTGCPALVLKEGLSRLGLCLNPSRTAEGYNQRPRSLQGLLPDC